MPRILLAIVICLVVAPCGASAQLVDVSALPTKATLTADDQQQIAAFAAAEAVRLNSTEASEVKAGRDRILRLVAQRGVTLDFRTKLTQALLPTLTKMVQGDDLHAANALRIAGELGAQSSIEMLTSALGDKRSSVRYAGTFAAARLFESVAQTNTGPTAQSLLSLVGVLTARIKPGATSEVEPNVLDGIMLALSKALLIDPEQIKERAFRESILSPMAAAISSRVKVLAQEDKAGEKFPVLLRAVGVLRDAVVTLRLAVPPKAKADIIACCGDIISAESALRAIKPDPALTPAEQANNAASLEEAVKAARNLQELLR